MQKRKAFTLVELLTVMAIIALLVGIAVPSLSAARKKAKETACRALINSIEQGLLMFRDDFGTYPSSASSPAGFANTGKYDMNDSEMNGVATVASINTGAHKLAEAMMGYDMLGYEENHSYCDSAGNVLNAQTRKGYIATDNLAISTLPDIAARKSLTGVVAGDTTWSNRNYVITDNLKAEDSLPLLYFKANKRAVLQFNFFNYADNANITNYLSNFGSFAVNDLTNQTLNNFNYYTWDYRTGTGNFGNPAGRPYNKDTFIIISAGFDQIYGTKDDICNFDMAQGKVTN